MKFLALNVDVNFIIANHLASDLKIRQLLSKTMIFRKYYSMRSYIMMIFVNI
jgi:hypothetical protein